MKPALLSIALVTVIDTPSPQPAAELPAWVEVRVAGAPKVAAKAFVLATDPLYRLFDSDTRAGSVLDGPLAGSWTFMGTPGSLQPTSGWRMLLPTSPPYKVTFELYCAESDCDALRRRIADVRAPAVYEDETLVAQWEQIVRTEVCDPGLPRDMSAPPYPPEEQRRGIAGDVTIGLFFNACGEVRKTWIVTSSGNRNLDRAVVRKAARWRVPVQGAGEERKARTTVSFSLDTPAIPQEVTIPPPPP